MYQGMTRCSAFDLSKTGQVPPLEIAIAVFELPQCRFRRAGVEDIAHCHESLVKIRARQEHSPSPL